LEKSRTTDSPGAANSAELFTRLAPRPAACALSDETKRAAWQSPQSMGDGPSSTGVICMEKERLARALDWASFCYSQAAETLRGRVGVLEKAEYQKLNRAVEEAWTKMEDARVALDRHIDEHRC
jgi:hypothetical protein